MTLEQDVARHYTTEGLLGRIDAALKLVGVDPERPSYDDLKPMDEFHTGGIEATTAVLDPLGIGPAVEVIDFGCGVGGTARHIAHRYGARVRGVDLTADFVEAGRELTRRLGLDDKVTLEQGSVLEVPFEAHSADLVTMIHVGMNIEDKAKVFAEAARVLRPGGRFVVFDVMRDDSDEELAFPLPWAEVPATSQVVPQGEYRRAAHGAGLAEIDELNMRDFALEFFARAFRHAAAEGPSPVGIHLMMGETATQKLENYVANVEARRIAPVKMIFRRP